MSDPRRRAIRHRTRPRRPGLLGAMALVAVLVCASASIAVASDDGQYGPSPAQTIETSQSSEGQGSVPADVAPATTEDAEAPITEQPSSPASGDGETTATDVEGAEVPQKTERSYPASAGDEGTPSDEWSTGDQPERTKHGRKSDRHKHKCGHAKPGAHPHRTCVGRPPKDDDESTCPGHDATSDASGSRCEEHPTRCEREDGDDSPCAEHPATPDTHGTKGEGHHGRCKKHPPRCKKHHGKGKGHSRCGEHRPKCGEHHGKKGDHHQCPPPVTPPVTPPVIPPVTPAVPPR